MTLGLWLLRVMAVRVLAATAAMVALLQTLDLFEMATKILDRGLGAGGVALYALLRTPHLIEQAAPIGMLAGALFAFGRLAGESAVIAMRATGVSAYRVVLLSSPAALAFYVTLVGLALWVVPHTDQRVQDWWRDTTPKAEREAYAAHSFRIGRDIVTATPTEETGRRLADLAIYPRGRDGALLARTTAPAARYDGRSWRLERAASEIVAGRTMVEVPVRDGPWTDRLTPADVRALSEKDAVISPADAKRALSGGAALRPAAVYRMALARIWAGPAAVLVMLLIAAPAALTGQRGGGLPLPVLSLAAGLLFLVVDGVFVSLGSSGAAPVFLTAWGAAVLFAAGAVTALLYLEG